jgi:hypothetical protein
MRLSTLEAALHAQPFRPFVLRVDGSTILIEHPDQVLFADQKTTTILDLPERMHIIDVAEFSGLTFVKRSSSRAAK